MPLVKGKSQAAFKTNVGTLMGEIGKSPHVQSRSQALAIAFSKQRSGKAAGGAVEHYASGGHRDWDKRIPPPLKIIPPGNPNDVPPLAPFWPDPPGYPALPPSRKPLAVGGAAMNPWMAARYAEGGRSKRYDPPIFENDKPLSYRQPSRREADYYSEDSSSPRSFGEHALAVGRAVFEGDKYREAVSGGRDTRNPLYDRRMRPLGFADGGMANPYAAGGVAPHIPTAPWYERNALRHAGPVKGMLGGASPGRVDNLPINVKSGSYVVPADVVSAIGQGNSKSGAKMMTKMFSGSKMNKYGGGNFRMPGVAGLQRGQFAAGGDVVPLPISPGLQAGKPTENEIYLGLGTSRLPRIGPHEGPSWERHMIRHQTLPLGPRGLARGGMAKEHVPIIAASGEFVICPEDVLAFGDGDMKRGHDALDNWVKGQRKKHIDTLRKLKPPKVD